jgi:hypothetical protein
MLFNFLGECGRERVNECFGAGICGKHGGGDDPAERANIQYQSVFPGVKSVRGDCVSRNQDVPFDHSRQHHSCDSDGGTDVDRDNIREFGRVRFRKVHRVRVRLSDVVYCANGKMSMKTYGK